MNSPMLLAAVRAIITASHVTSPFFQMPVANLVLQTAIYARRWEAQLLAVGVLAVKYLPKTLPQHSKLLQGSLPFR